MGLQLMAFKCPDCGQMMSETMGPNFTVLGDAPRPNGWTVVMLVCLNGTCQRPLGTYAFPPE